MKIHQVARVGDVGLFHISRPSRAEDDDAKDETAEANSEDDVLATAIAL